MSKAIIVLTGEPEQKKRFIEVSKRIAWVKNRNAKSELGRITEKLFIGDKPKKDDEYYDFIAEVLKLANKYAGYETKYIRQEIEGFLRSDGSSGKKNSGFNNDLLIIHGLSRALREELKDEYPLFVIRLGRSDQKSNETFQDYLIETDLPDYEKSVENLVTILSK